MSNVIAHSQPRIEGWVRHGVIGGIGAGIVFAMFEMIMAAILNGADAFFTPLRMIAGIGLGQQALQPSYTLATAIIVGLAIHMMTSAIFGLVFAGILRYVPAFTSSTSTVLVATSVLGVGLWLVNFYLIANIAGWVWFPDKANPVVQFFAHTFFFGTAFGLYLNAAARRS
jgi:hypothetical protein